MDALPQSREFVVVAGMLVYNAGSDFQDVAVGAGDQVAVRDEQWLNEFQELAERA